MDSPEEIYERPRTTFVAGFIGVSNLMPGEVVSTGSGMSELRLDAGPTVRTGAGSAQLGERAHAVVRPEKLELHGVNGAVPVTAARASKARSRARSTWARPPR